MEVRKVQQLLARLSQLTRGSVNLCEVWRCRTGALKVSQRLCDVISYNSSISACEKVLSSRAGEKCPVFSHESRKPYETLWYIMNVMKVYHWEAPCSTHHGTSWLLLPEAARWQEALCLFQASKLHFVEAASLWSLGSESPRRPRYTVCTTIEGFPAGQRSCCLERSETAARVADISRRTDALRTSRLCDFYQMSLDSRH